MTTELTHTKLQAIFAQSHSESAQASTPLQAFRTLVETYAEAEDISIDAALTALANKPNYGSSGEGASVNVFENEVGDTRVEWSVSENGTWVTLESLVEVLEKGQSIPAWFEPEWHKSE